MKEQTSVLKALPWLSRAELRPLSTNSFSIRTKIIFSFVVMILLMGTVNASIIILGLQDKYQYDNLLQNITTANSINGYVKPTIDGLIWNIVAGKPDINERSQYRGLDYVVQAIEVI